jgi:hypothetical protein
LPGYSIVKHGHYFLWLMPALGERQMSIYHTSPSPIPCYPAAPAGLRVHLNLPLALYACGLLTTAMYYDSIPAWSRLLSKRFEMVPDHPDWGYYGDGGERENAVRPICYAAMTNAFLAEVEPPGAGVNDEYRDLMRHQAVAALRYVTRSRLVACYLMHALLGEGAPPVTEQQFEESITGVTRLEHGQAILHRTPHKFASFAWGRQRMALAIPRGGSWVVWPHFASYSGQINGQDASQRNAVLVDLQEDIHPDRFTVCGRPQRCNGQIQQDFVVASLREEIMVYIERLRVKDGCRIESRETGIVGHEYPLDSNRRMIFGGFGSRDLVGVGNPAAIHELETDWLNLGRKIGFVVCRHTGHENLMRYHDFGEGTGRVPKLQEWLSLVGESDPSSNLVGDDWACIVTFLNQSPQETAQWASRVRFDADGDVATCHLDAHVVRANFATRKTLIAEEPCSIGHRRGLPHQQPIRKLAQ